MSGSRITHSLVALDSTDSATWLKKDICEGEVRLMAAVLKDAVNCFQEYVFGRSGFEKQQFQEVEEWFSEKDSKEHFSFENICEILQLDPDYLRQGLMSWKKAKLAKVTRAR
jgi:hypothetical protein